MSASAGWHPDPESPGVMRYWNGDAWTNHRAPVQPQGAPGGVSVWKIVAGVGLGILAAVAALYFFFGVAHSSDGLNCETRSAERVTNGESPLDCSQYGN